MNKGWRKVILSWCTLIWNHILYILLHISAAASGWAGWAFGSSVNPITTRGADYAHLITASPPGFENLAASMLTWYCLSISGNLTGYKIISDTWLQNCFGFHSSAEQFSDHNTQKQVKNHKPTNNQSAYLGISLILAVVTFYIHMRLNVNGSICL